LRAAVLVATIRTLEAAPLIYREEVTAILGVLGDLNVHVRRILDLIESEFDGQEELEEDDT
jgi:hypothetical protein